MAAIALRFTRLFYSVGRFSLLLSKACASLSDIAIYRKNVFIQMGRIGIDSIPIVILAAAFSGAVTTVQTSYQLVSPLFPPSTIGAVVVQSLTMELGAVITGFILSGRVGARIAAELGTMRVTEQIDALEVMGLNSVGYLIVPRVLAGILMFPILYVAACFIGIVGGIIAGTLTGTVSMGEFFQGGTRILRCFWPLLWPHQIIRLRILHYLNLLLHGLLHRWGSRRRRKKHHEGRCYQLHLYIDC